MSEPRAELHVDRGFSVHIAGRRYPLRALSGREGLSEPFRFEAELAAVPQDEIEPARIVEREVLLVLEEGGASTVIELRRITAVATACRLEASLGAASIVRMTLEPRLALTRLRAGWRAFRDRSVPEIVESVLAAHGLAVERQLTRDYPRRACTYQVRESDFALVSRLLEDEGIHYTLTDAGEVVLGDHADYLPLAGDPDLPFSGRAGLAASEVLLEVGLAADLGVGKVALSDFDFARPSLDLRAAAGQGLGELYRHPGGYREPDDGKQRAALLCDAHAAQTDRLVGATTSTRVRPGALFRVVDAPDAELDGNWAVVEVVHAWRRDGAAFEVRFEAIREDVVFRPLPATPRPLLADPLTARVVGPAGADVHGDAWGRVKIRFPWERDADRDAGSDWVPVAQDNTGESSAVPRVGWEVLVHFIDGDPDRPVVLGRLYNGEDPFPTELPTRKTVSMLRSLTSPRGGSLDETGTNYICFEDLAHEEQLIFQAERDQRLVVANDKREEVHATEANAVARDEAIDIGHDETRTIAEDMSLDIDGSQRHAVGGDRRRAAGTGDVSEVSGNRQWTIGAAHVRKMGTEDAVGAAALAEHIGGACIERSVSASTLRAPGSGLHVVGGSLLEIAGGARSETATEQKTESTGGLAVMHVGDGVKSRVARTRLTDIEGSGHVLAKEPVTLAGPRRLALDASVLELAAPTGITLKVGGTLVTMMLGVTELKTKSVIRIVTTGDANLAADKAELL